MTDLNADKLNNFARFISLLTGELDVRVVSSEAPEHGAVVLPSLDNLDDASIDVLYGLCLREAGYIAKSRKTVHSVAKLKTERELQAAMLAEGARIERFLIRKFGGGAEILEEHFKLHAANPRFSKIVLGVDPALACADEVFLYAMKWNLLGRPRWGWNKLFDARLWEQAVEALNDTEFDEIISAPQRKFEDSVDVGVKALHKWLSRTQRPDDSVRREKPAEQQVWEEALNEANTRLKQLAQEAQDKINQKKEQLEKLSEKVREEEERIAPQANPLRDQRTALKKDNQKYEDFADELNSFTRLDKQKSKLESRAERESGKLEKLSERVDNSDPNELMEKLEARAQALQDKIDAAQQRVEEKTEKLNQQMENLQKKELDLNEKVNKEGLAPERKEKIEQRLADVMEQIEAIQKKLDDLNQSGAEKLKGLEEKAQKTSDRSQQRLESAQERAQNAEQKLASTQEAVDEMNAQRERLQKQMDKLSKEMESKLGKGESAEEALQKMMEAHNQMQGLSESLEKVEATRNELRTQLSEQRKAMRAEQRTENWKMEQELQQIEQKMEAAGMPLNLTEKMVEMEGWDAANTAQRNFDNKASHEYEMSVINGCGGGRGTRDVMLNVDDLSNAIEDLDPNLIFADVARLSPLSGFSESGVRDSDEGAANKNAPVSASMTMVGKIKHTVWTRKFDKVIAVPSPMRSTKTVNDLRKQYGKEISAVKKTFLQHLKPSFKAKFVGGKEEGSLDARNIWKLAARQGEDFFEAVHKRPNNKAAATILVDLSGSCASWGPEGIEVASEKIQALTLMLSEGLTAVNIPHEILGYSAPLEDQLADVSIPQTFNRKVCRLETLVAKGFKDKDLAGIAGLVVQQADNSDGESLRIATDRLLKQHGQNKMLFMISDGKPFMQDADSAVLDDDLRLALMEAAQKKIVVSCLGLAQEHAVMGDAYLSLQDVNDLPRAVKDVLTK